LFKDIIVNLGAGKSGKIVGDYATSVASSLEAHITGIAIAFVPDIQRAGMAFLSVERIEALQRDNEAAAETIVEWFVAATASAGVLAEKRILRANMSNAADQFGRIARRFDLAIVGQVEPDGSPVQAMVSESTLFESGRPMIIVPYARRRHSSSIASWSVGTEVGRPHAPSPTPCHFASERKTSKWSV
jgi:uncharacterized membrane protein (Fun14 family)